jgi:hypothetical protein
MLPVFLFAGDGEDTNFDGGGGPTVAVGGTGGVTLEGGSGRSILIAGAGGGHLIGGSEDNILIGGYTAYDNNLAALQAILAEWNSADSFAARVTALSGYFNTGTVFDNDVADRLQGGGDQNWFFADLSGSDHDRLSRVDGDDKVVNIQ